MRRILLIALAIILTGCYSGVSKRIPVMEGDTRVTLTETHAIHERCIGCDGFGHPRWDLDYIESRDEYDSRTGPQPGEEKETIS